MSDEARGVLRSPDFKPTDGVTYKIAVLKGMHLADKNRITKKIRAEADKRGLSKPNTELACLIREKFTDEEFMSMDLWWLVTMHEPINGSDGYPRLLYAHPVRGGRWLDAHYGHPGNRLGSECGFAFTVSQVNS
ncbi:hypothetical protein ACFL6I_15590 [candidate division KSB1 bacterium]